MIKIDPPTTYKWDVITSIFGITNANKLVKYITDSEGKKILLNEISILYSLLTNIFYVYKYM